MGRLEPSGGQQSPITMLSATILLTCALSNPALAQQLPLVETSRKLEPTRLVLKGMDWDMAHGSPQLPPGAGFIDEDALLAGYWIVQADSTSALLKLRSMVRELGGTCFDYVPHNAFEVRLPAAAVASLRSR